MYYIKYLKPDSELFKGANKYKKYRAFNLYRYINISDIIKLNKNYTLRFKYIKNFFKIWF